LAILNFCGFESGDSSELNATTGTFSIQNSTVRSGEYALRCNPDTTAVGRVTIVGLTAAGQQQAYSQATVYCRFYFRYATKPAANDEEIFTFFTGAGAMKLALRLDSAGKLVVYDRSNTKIATGATVLSANTWYRIEITSASSATAAYELRIDGSTELSGTLDTIATNHGQIRLGKNSDRNGQSVDLFYDDVLIDSAAFPGAGSVHRMDANTDGTYTAWTSSNGVLTPNIYTELLPVPHDSDLGYITTSSSGAAFTAQLESATEAGISGVVKAVKSVAIVRDEGGVSSISIRLRSGSTDDDTTANDPGASYTARQKLYETDPATSAVWNTSALDSLQVGVVSAAAVALRCTSAWAMVAASPETEMDSLLTLGVS